MYSTEKTYVTEGERVTIEAPYSEVCMHMGCAGNIMEAELCGYSAQLYLYGKPFSAPILMGEAGFYRDSDGTYFYAPESE